MLEVVGKNVSIQYTAQIWYWNSYPNSYDKEKQFDQRSVNLSQIFVAFFIKPDL